MAEILGISLKTIADFMDAAQGNYRNALYISCNICGYIKESHCGDFLFIAGADGAPILLPLSDAEQFFGCKIDYSDCNGRMGNIDFLKLYHKWIELNTVSDHTCPYHQMLHQANHIIKEI